MAKRYIMAVHADADQRKTKVILDNGDELVGIMSAEVNVQVGAISMGTIEFALMGASKETSKAARDPQEDAERDPGGWGAMKAAGIIPDQGTDDG